MGTAHIVTSESIRRRARLHRAGATGHTGTFTINRRAAASRMSRRKQLLIVHHTQSGHTGRMADAVLAGAARCTRTDTRLLRAFDAGVDDLLGCDGLIIGTPENFGYMSGAIKDFFDRTYYPCEGRLTGLPYALFVSAGNDGSGAVREVGRIATGYGWKLVAEALVARKEVTAQDIARCEELGETMATGIDYGAF
jgi:multimeric flavodoxin WrbA